MDGRYKYLRMEEKNSSWLKEYIFRQIRELKAEQSISREKTQHLVISMGHRLYPVIDSKAL